MFVDEVESIPYCLQAWQKCGYVETLSVYRYADSTLPVCRYADYTAAGCEYMGIAVVNNKNVNMFCMCTGSDYCVIH